MTVKMKMDTAMQLAPRRARERGREYFEDGLVIDLAERKGLLIAKVEGGRTYTVKMSTNADENFHYSCTCPMGDQGEFCKHCVAVALSWIDSGKSKNTEATPVLKLKDIESHLHTLDKAVLVEMMMELVQEHDALRKKICLKAPQARSVGFDAASWKQIIRNAFETPDFVYYR